MYDRQYEFTHFRPLILSESIVMSKWLITASLFVAVLAVALGTISRENLFRSPAKNEVSIAFAIEVEEPPTSAIVRLHKATLGTGISEAVVDVSTAKSLGVGVVKNFAVRQTPFGVFLLDYPLPDGTIPAVYLTEHLNHNDDGIREALRSHAIVPLKMSFVSGGKIRLSPRKQAFQEHQGLISRLQNIEDKHEFTIEIPQDLAFFASQESGGTRVFVNIVSLTDGTEMERHFDFIDAADTKRGIALESKGTTKGPFGYWFRVEGMDGRPIRKWESLASGFLVNPTM